MVIPGRPAGPGPEPINHRPLEYGFRPRRFATPRNDTRARGGVMDGPATGTGIGQPVRRREDLRLLTGNGRYSDDVSLPGQAYAVMRGIDASASRAIPGILAVLTGEDVLADGLQPLPNIANSHPADISIQNKDGSPVVRPQQAAIIWPELCHVGEIV